MLGGRALTRKKSNKCVEKRKFHAIGFSIRSDGINENFLLRKGTESSRLNNFSVGCRGRFRSDSVGRSVGRKVGHNGPAIKRRTFFFAASLINIYCVHIYKGEASIKKLFLRGGRVEFTPFATKIGINSLKFPTNARSNKTH